jgi:hypothetical protein
VHAPGWLRRFGIALGAAIGTAFVAAIALAILDLYLTGHNYPSISRTWIDWPAVGIRLSYGDVVWWVLIAAAAIVTWTQYGREG